MFNPEVLFKVIELKKSGYSPSEISTIVPYALSITKEEYFSSVGTFIDASTTYLNNESKTTTV